MDLDELRRARMGEPGAKAGYERARRAFELGARIRQLREQAGLTQSELASRSGTSQAAIARLEAGGVEPRISTLERVGTALGRTLVVDFASSASRP